MKENVLGKKLRELRLERGISQKELGENLGFCNQSVSFWETGQREPDLDSIVKICKYFDVTSDFLLGLKEY